MTETRNNVSVVEFEQTFERVTTWGRSEPSER